MPERSGTAQPPHVGLVLLGVLTLIDERIDRWRENHQFNDASGYVLAELIELRQQIIERSE